MSFIRTLSFLFLSVTAAAFANEADIKPAYCPSEVVCTVAGDIDSCTFEQDEQENWDSIKNSDANDLSAGTYQLDFLMGLYHSTDTSSMSQCIYENKDDGYKELYLNAKPEANLEAFPTAESYWNIWEDFGYCYGDYRNPTLPSDCPLKRQSAVHLSNLTFTHHWADASAYGGNKIVDINTDSNGAKVIYDDLGHCEAKMPCKIDIVNASGKVGTITVAISNRLDILSIENSEEAIYSLRKNGDFNSIEVIGTDSPPSFAMGIYHTLSSPLMTYVHGVPVMDKPIPALPFDLEEAFGFVGYESVQEECAESHCQIDIKTTQGMRVGSVIVDMDDPMKIVSFTVHRADEISIEKHDENTLRIFYPFK